MAAGPEWAIGFHGDAPLFSSLEQLSAVLKRTELHLVHDGRDSCLSDHLLQFSDVEVGHADRAGEAELTSTFHPGPRPGGTTLRPVNDVHVDVVDAEALQAALNLGHRVLVAWIELCGKEHLPARHSALSQTPPDAFLIEVGL